MSTHLSPTEASTATAPGLHTRLSRRRLLAVGGLAVGGAALSLAAACAAPAAPAPTTAPAAPTTAPAAAKPTTAPAAPAPTTAPAAAATVEPTPVRPSAPPATNLPKFNNASLNFVGDAGHNLNPLKFWADDFKQAGLDIKPIEVPFEGVYEKEKAEFVAGTGAFDTVVFYPAYVGDFAGNGYLEPLDEWTKKYDPHLDDIIPAFLELYCRWDGKLYALPYDGDVHMLIYRKDLFEHPDEQAAFKQKYSKDLKPPETWDDWLQVGEFFTRKAGDKLAGQTLSQPLYGLAEFGKRGFSFAWFLNRFASMGGVYFDEQMKPQINTEQGVKALQNFVDALKFAPPDVRGYGYDELRDALLNGNVAMVVQWTDVPKKGADPTQSKVVGKLGYGVVPGSVRNGQVVHRAMMPVGRVLAVAKDSKVKEQAYWVAKYLSDDRSLPDVSTSETGLDPYRKSHFQHPEAYTMFKEPSDVQVYLKAVQANLEVGYPEVYIPGAAQYEEALDLAVNKALSNQGSPKEVLDQAAADWENITNKLGRDKQVKLWTSAIETYKKLGLWHS